MAKQKNLALIFSVVIFSLAVSYAYSAWQEPTASPPNNNVAPAASYWVSCTGGICYTSGNVGIGTTAPDEKLDVVGKIVFGDTDTKKAKLFRDSGWLHIQNLADTYDISLDGPLHIRTGGPSDTVDEVIVTSGGNVGIGTTSPTGKLHVRGGRVYVDSDNFGLTPTIDLAVGDTDTGLDSAGDGQLDLWSNNVKTMSIRAGNVGIGTTSPAQKLHVAGNVQAIAFKGTGDYQSVWGGWGNSIWLERDSHDGIFYNDPTSKKGFMIGFHGLNDLIYLGHTTDSWSTGGYLGAISGSTGNVGIGTTSPAAKLDVVGDAKISGKITAGLVGNYYDEEGLPLLWRVIDPDYYEVFFNCPGGRSMIAGGCSCSEDGEPQEAKLRISMPYDAVTWVCVCERVSGSGNIIAHYSAFCSY